MEIWRSDLILDIFSHLVHKFAIIKAVIQTLSIKPPTYITSPYQKAISTA